MSYFGIMLCFVIGISGLGVAIHFQRRQSRFWRRAVRLPGTVVGMLAKDEGLSSPRVRFVDDRGEEHHLDASVASYPPKYTVGQSVGVLFDRETGRSMLDTWIELKTLFLISYTVFGALLGVGVTGLLLNCIAQLRSP